VAEGFFWGAPLVGVGNLGSEFSIEKWIEDMYSLNFLEMTFQFIRISLKMMEDEEIWLVVWNMNFIFPLGSSSSQLTKSIIFQRGRRKTTNQSYP
jgi:hypothetical protein